MLRCSERALDSVQLHDNVFEVIVCRHLLVIIAIAREHLPSLFSNRRGIYLNNSSSLHMHLPLQTRRCPVQLTPLSHHWTGTFLFLLLTTTSKFGGRRAAGRSRCEFEEECLQQIKRVVLEARALVAGNTLRFRVDTSGKWNFKNSYEKSESIKQGFAGKFWVTELEGILVGCHRCAV